MKSFSPNQVAPRVSLANRLFCWLLIALFSIGNVNAATVLINLEDLNYDPLNTTVTFEPVRGYGINGTVLFPGLPKSINTTNGTNQINLQPGVYKVIVSGVNKDIPMIAVPTNNPATYTLVSLITNMVPYGGPVPYLPLEGGTLTGPLTLSGPPTDPLHAATRQFVLDNAGGEGGTPPSGTGFRLIVGGSEQSTAALVSNAMVAANAAIDQSKISGLVAALAGLQTGSADLTNITTLAGTMNNGDLIMRSNGVFVTINASLLGGSGGSPQTPWGVDINAAGFKLTNAASVTAGIITNTTFRGGTIYADAITNSGTGIRFGGPGTAGHYTVYTNGFWEAWYNTTLRGRWGRGFLSFPSADSTPEGATYYSPSNGKLFLLNGTYDDFSMLGLGLQTSAFPAFKRSGPGVQLRLGDDSAFTGIQLNGLTNNGTSYMDGLSVTSTVTLPANSIVTAYLPVNVITRTNLGPDTVASTNIVDGVIIDADVNASAAIAQSKISGLVSDLAAKQPLDSDLTGIAGLTYTGGTFPMWNGSAWVLQGTNAFGSGSGSTEVVASGYHNKGDGAVATNGSTYTLYRNFDPAKTKLYAIGDSHLAGNNRLYAKMTNGSIVKGWTNLAGYGNYATNGATLNTNVVTTLLPFAPAAGETAIVLVSFDANADGQSIEGTSIVRSNMNKMLKTAGFQICEIITTSWTNDTQLPKKKVSGEYIKREVLTGQIDYAVSADELLSLFMFNDTFSTDRQHYTDLGYEMLARAVDATIRQGPGNLSHMPNVPWRYVTAAGTNISLAMDHQYTGQRLVTIDAYTGSASFAGSVNGGFGVPMGFAIFGDGTTVTTGTGLFSYHFARGYTVTNVFASLATASSAGGLEIDVKKGGVSILSTKVYIDQGEKHSGTAQTNTVISSGVFAKWDELTVDVSVAGASATGLKVQIEGNWAP